MISTHALVDRLVDGAHATLAEFAHYEIAVLENGVGGKHLSKLYDPIQAEESSSITPCILAKFDRVRQALWSRIAVKCEELALANRAPEEACASLGDSFTASSAQSARDACR